MFKVVDVWVSLGDADNGISLEESPVGQEFVKKVEAFFCEVCQRYLSRVEPLEKGLEIHCRTRSHHQAFEERLNGDKIQDRQTREERMEVLFNAIIFIVQDRLTICCVVIRTRTRRTWKRL